MKSNQKEVLLSKDQVAEIAAHLLNNVFSEDYDALAGITYWHAHYKETGDATELVTALEQTNDFINKLIKELK